ncbi:winged helix-turn-helix domain-containing protein [Massilia sp. LjRoot122]|uniref:winged helix-turn-helix domain-containing protein n=1 Tax=Massilia sp. LjRoot122 TaxID=3342257 RepID=UPI003ED01C03
MVQTVLMIEDDERLAGMVATYLAPHGFDVRHALSAQEGIAILQREQDIRLVLLDLMLPDADGLDVCRRIRALAAPLCALPIVMLTAKGDPLDRVVGLEIGADDYLPKPFEPRELLARLRAVLRRPPMAADPAARVLRFGRLEIDPGARTVRLDGEARALTAYQFDLLVALAERAGRVLSRDQLLEAVKGQAIDPFDRSIDVHIGRLRLAIEDDVKQPRRIITVRGAGYVFAKVHDA